MLSDQRRTSLPPSPSHFSHVSSAPPWPPSFWTMRACTARTPGLPGGVTSTYVASDGNWHLYSYLSSQLTVIMSLSVTVAMYCLIQIYVTISEPLKPQKPLLKLFAIKAVVFLTFWQATFLSLLTMAGVVKNVSPFYFLTSTFAEFLFARVCQTQYMTADNINIGIGAVAECVEMT